MDGREGTKMVVEGSQSERRHFSDTNPEAAVEYMAARPHENFVIYEIQEDVFRRIRNALPGINLRRGD